MRGDGFVWNDEIADMPCSEEPGRLLVDVSATRDGTVQVGTGIWRVVSNIYRELKAKGRTIVPVRDIQGMLYTDPSYPDSPAPGLVSESTAIRARDRLFLLEPSWRHVETFARILEEMRNKPAESFVLVHDLLPMTRPEFFPVRLMTFARWHEMVMQKADHIICDSKYTADEIERYMNGQGWKRKTELKLHVLHMAISGPGNAAEEVEAREEILRFLQGQNVFLMVGTVEPRKGYQTVLEAFHEVRSVHPCRLLILGKRGWMNEKVIDFVTKYSRDEILWVQDASDEELSWAYRHARALIAASHVEGFGLPLIEAASYGLPILCSDIPVFHEATQEQAVFFPAGDAKGMARVWKAWMMSDLHPDSRRIRLYTWEETAGELMDIFCGKAEPYKRIPGTELPADCKAYGVPFLHTEPESNRCLRRSLQNGNRLLVDMTASRDGTVAVGTGIWRVVTNIYQGLGKLGNIMAVRDANGIVCMDDRYPLPVDPSDPLEVVEFRPGDKLFLLNKSWEHSRTFAKVLEELPGKGAESFALVHDILPLTRPEFFIKKLIVHFTKWQEMVIGKVDHIICYSRHTADEIEAYFFKARPSRKNALRLYVVHMALSAPEADAGEREVRTELVQFLQEQDVFMMVGTMEPRKGHQVVLDAFQEVRSFYPCRLLILGKRGWMDDGLVASIGAYSDGEVLWIRDATDVEVRWAYQHARALIAASYDEGFGLPLIEAASYGLPILCSDIPVFHEATQGHATFFPAGDASGLAHVWKEWLSGGMHPDSRRIRLYTWEETARELMEIFYGKSVPYKEIR